MVLSGNSLFKLTLAGCQRSSYTKILLMVHMRPAAITLNYSIENIRNNIRQKIYEKFQFDSLVWGSLTLAPIKAQFDNCLSSSLLMPAKKTLWQQLSFMVCWLSLFLVQQNNTSTWSKRFGVAPWCSCPIPQNIKKLSWFVTSWSRGMLIWWQLISWELISWHWV